MAFEKLRTIVITAIPHYYLEGKITLHVSCMQNACRKLLLAA